MIMTMVMVKIDENYPILEAKMKIPKDFNKIPGSKILGNPVPKNPGIPGFGKIPSRKIPGLKFLIPLGPDGQCKLEKLRMEDGIYAENLFICSVAYFCRFEACRQLLSVLESDVRVRIVSCGIALRARLLLHPNTRNQPTFQIYHSTMRGQGW